MGAHAARATSVDGPYLYNMYLCVNISYWTVDQPIWLGIFTSRQYFGESKVFIIRLLSSHPNKSLLFFIQTKLARFCLIS